jgi:hypothetical protein
MVWDVGHAFDMPRKHDAVSFWVDLVSLRGIQDIRSLSGASIPEIVGKCVKTVAFAGASANYLGERVAGSGEKVMRRTKKV